MEYMSKEVLASTAIARNISRRTVPSSRCTSRMKKKMIGIIAKGTRNINRRIE